MAALVTAQANSLINAILAGSAVGATTSIKTRYTTSAPTASSAGTELSGGSGYTTGGTVTAWTSASAGAASNTTALTNTNSSGSTWSIVGLELWDTAGTPLRWLFGLWTGQPISIANGNTFAVSASAITVTAS